MTTIRRICLIALLIPLLTFFSSLSTMAGPRDNRVDLSYPGTYSTSAPIFVTVSFWEPGSTQPPHFPARRLVVTGFEENDINVSGGTVTGVTTVGGALSGSVYTVVIQPDGSNNDIEFFVYSAAAQTYPDGYDTLKSREASISYDPPGPLTLSYANFPAAIGSTDPFTVDLVGSERARIANPGNDEHAAWVSALSVTNGTLTASMGSAQPNGVRHLQITPDGSGDVQITVPANSVEERGGTRNAAAASLTIPYQTSQPIAVLSAPGVIGRPPAEVSVTARFTQPMNVGSFDTNRIAIQNGVLASVPNFSDSRTASFDVRSDGSGNALRVSLQAGAVKNAAGTDNQASVPIVIAADITSPSVTISDTPTSVSGLAPFNALVIFSEPVTGFTASDVALQNASIDRIIPSGDGARYLLKVRPDGQGDINLAILQNIAQDAAGNRNTAYTNPTTGSHVLVIPYHGSAPSVSFSNVPASRSNTSSFSLDVQFSEPVTGFDVQDIIGQHMQVGPITGSGANYVMQLTPLGTGNIRFQVRQGAALSAGNVPSRSSAVQIIPVDLPGAPSVSVLGAPAQVSTTAAFNVNVTFSEGVQGFEFSDMNVTNGRVTSFGGNGREYQLAVTPDGSGDITLQVPAAAAQDGGGVDNTASAPVVVRYNASGAPSAILSGAPATRVGTAPIDVTLTFSESVTGLEAGDFDITNASVTNITGSGRNYTVRITPDGSGAIVVTGPISLQLRGGTVADIAGDTNTASNTVTIAHGAPAAPTLMMTGPATALGLTPIRVNATFSENVTGFEASDVTVTNGAVSAFSGSGAAYLLTIVPAGTGNIEVEVPGNAATSAGGQGNAAPNPLIVPWSSAPTPMVNLTGAPANAVGLSPFAVTATFSEDVIGFDAGDINVSNAMVTMTAQSASTYRIEVAPNGNGNITLSVPPGVATNQANMFNQGSNPVTIPWSPASSRPSVTLSGAPSSYTGTGSFSVTATFSEAVTGFDTTDLRVSNGSAALASGGGTQFTINVHPNGNGDLTLHIPQDAATSAAGIGTAASNIIVVTRVTTTPASAAIAGFMQDRANNLASNQPGLTRLLRGGDHTSMDIHVSRGQGNIDGAFLRGNLWGELKGSWSGNRSYILGSFGTHLLARDDLIIGGMLQLDYAKDDSDNITGNGWMFGPYFAARHAVHPLIFEGRFLYGKTSNDITTTGGATDHFTTERFLAQFGATGEINQESITWLPGLGVTHTEDHQKAYVSSGGATVPEQSFRLTQVNARLGFRLPINVEQGKLELDGAMAAIYSSSTGNAVSGASRPDYEGYRGRIELGLTWDLRPQSRFRLNGFYDGVGSTHESWGAGASFNVEF